VLDAIAQECAAGDGREDPGHGGDVEPLGVAVDAAAVHRCRRWQGAADLPGDAVTDALRLVKGQGAAVPVGE